MLLQVAPPLWLGKAVQDVAMTSVPEWAGALAGEVIATYDTLLREQGSALTTSGRSLSSRRRTHSTRLQYCEQARAKGEGIESSMSAMAQASA